MAMIKGYKAFKPDMTCRRKQYAENTMFEEREAELCKKGMHFCDNALDVLRYYPILDDDLNMPIFATVESDEAYTLRSSDDSKCVTSRLYIGNKIDLNDLINAHVVACASIRRAAQEASNEDYAYIVSHWGNAMIASNRNYAKITSGGDHARIASNGKNAVIMCSGRHCEVKAKCGSWITLANWWGTTVPVAMITFQIDGEKYKPDTWYTLKGGAVVEL